MNKKFDELQLNPGAQVMYDNKVCEIISALSIDQIMLKDVNGRHSFAAKIADIKPIDTNVELETAESSPVLGTTQEWEKAKKREEVIAELSINGCTKKSVQEAARELDVSTRQIYTLISRYRDSGFKLTSLLTSSSGGGKGKSRLVPKVEQIIGAVIEELFLSKQKHKASYVIQEINRRCYLVGLRAPDRNTIYGRINKLSPYKVKKAREGRGAAKMFAPIYGSFPEAKYPLAIFQMDHTKVDLILVDEVYREPIGRPYLTVAIDVFSRCIAGFYLTLEAPSATSVGLCLTNAVFEKDPGLIIRNMRTSWPIWGKPDVIYVDNGKEFHSEALARGCDLHGIKIEFRPVGQPHFGGIIERVIGTLMQLVHNLPGTTFSNVKEKGGYDSEKMAALTLSELDYWLTIAIVDYYHKKIHSTLRMAPIEKYKIGILGDSINLGRGYPPKIANKKAFLIDFLPIVRRALGRGGFVLDHIEYYSNAIAPLIWDRKKYGQFIIRRDPRDLSKIYVLDPIGKFYIEVPYRTIYRPTINLWEHRAAIKKLNTEGIKQIDERKIFNTIETLRKLAKEAAHKTKNMRKNLERINNTNQGNVSHRIDNKDNEQKSMMQANYVERGIEYIQELEEIKPFANIEVWST